MDRLLRGFRVSASRVSGRSTVRVEVVLTKRSKEGGADPKPHLRSVPNAQDPELTRRQTYSLGSRVQFQTQQFRDEASSLNWGPV